MRLWYRPLANVIFGNLRAGGILNLATFSSRGSLDLADFRVFCFIYQNLCFQGSWSFCDLWDFAITVASRTKHCSVEAAPINSFYGEVVVLWSQKYGEFSALAGSTPSRRLPFVSLLGQVISVWLEGIGKVTTLRSGNCG